MDGLTESQPLAKELREYLELRLLGTPHFIFDEHGRSVKDEYGNYKIVYTMSTFSESKKRKKGRKKWSA